MATMTTGIDGINGIPTGSIGWDTSLAGENGSSSDNTGMSFDANSLIERTREIKVDANDYSRFDKIVDSDEETENDKAKVSPAATINDKCRNCHKPGAKLKCSVCKKAVYCARTCQASDWQFHKRICKKPEPPKKQEERPRKNPSSSSSSSSSTTATATKETPSKPASNTKPAASTKNKTNGSTEVVVDEPDLPSDMRGYKNGLPYFHRELTQEEKHLIGDIAPQKIEASPATTAPVAHQGSAWNTAGTFEERMYTTWAEQKWTELFADHTFSEGNVTATLKTPEKINGDASICVVRGKKRFLFDFNFQLPFEVSVIGGATYKGKYTMNEISNDEDYEISYTWKKKPANTDDLNLLQKFIGTRSGGLQKELLRIIGEFTRDFQRQ